jgi:hypothetical protein
MIYRPMTSLSEAQMGYIVLNIRRLPVGALAILVDISSPTKEMSVQG